MPKQMDNSHTHFIKIEERWFSRITREEKTYELRKNDRDYQVGDVIFFEIIRDFWSKEDITLPADLKPIYIITHVLTSDVCEGLEKGYCILSIMPNLK